MWSLPPSDTVLHLLSYVALTAQAMTAALAAGRRSMDWAGVCMLGCITALGGGTIRDVLLGHYPLVWVQNPSYLALTAVAAFATILIARHVHRLNTAFLVLDAIGLVVFTMAGCDVAWQMNASLPIVIVAGMITGCAGGVLRDILCNDVPLLFRAELYASVSVADRTVLRHRVRAQAQRRTVDRADLCIRPDAAPAGDPLQMGNAEIRVQWRTMSFLNTTGPHPEEPAKRASRRMAASTPASHRLRDAACAAPHHEGLLLRTPRLRHLVRRHQGAALPQALRI